MSIISWEKGAKKTTGAPVKGRRSQRRLEKRDNNPTEDGLRSFLAYPLVSGLGLHWTHLTTALHALRVIGLLLVLSTGQEQPGACAEGALKHPSVTHRGKGPSKLKSALRTDYFHSKAPRLKRTDRERYGLSIRPPRPGALRNEALVVVGLKQHPLLPRKHQGAGRT